MKKYAIAILMSSFVAAPALADDTGIFYVAGDFGSATYSNLPFPNSSVIRIAGGYHFSPVLAVEMGLSWFGDSSADLSCCGPTTMSLTSFQVAAVASVPLSQQFDLLGKLGLVSNSEDWAASFGPSGTYYQSDLLIGFGAQFHLNRQASLRVLYDNYGKFDDTSVPVKASSVSMGLVYDLY